MRDKYLNLKLSIKTISQLYEGPAKTTLDCARVAITDLQEELKFQKSITDLAVKGLEEIINMKRYYSPAVAITISEDTLEEIRRITDARQE